MTRISFLVPTFNRAAFLGDALAAICRQLGKQDEVLVIDDGSTDSTAEIVSATGSRVRYLRQDNAGKSAALNRGLAETTGEFVWICDDDDRLRPDVVSPLVSLLERGGAGFAFGRYTRFDDETGRDIGTGYWPDLSSGGLLRHILEDGFVMQNAAVIRRSALAAVGPFSAHMPRSLDYEMFVRLACSFPAAYSDMLVFDQRKHAGPRGPAAMLHQASASMRIWNEYDRAIFQNLYRCAPLKLFEAMYQAPSGELRHRAALLQRAIVMARHDCWIEACSDLEAAANVATEPLDAGEYCICLRMLAGKHEPAGLVEDPVLERLRALSRRDPLGRQVVDALLAGGLWRLRSAGQLGSRAVLLAARTIAGPRFAAVALKHKLTRRAVARLREERDLPPDAYLQPGSIPPARPNIRRPARG